MVLCWVLHTIHQLQLLLCSRLHCDVPLHVVALIEHSIATTRQGTLDLGLAHTFRTCQLHLHNKNGYWNMLLHTCDIHTYMYTCDIHV